MICRRKVIEINSNKRLGKVIFKEEVKEIIYRREVREDNS